MINRRRIVRSPRFETAPSFCLPPVDFCSGDEVAPIVVGLSSDDHQLGRLSFWEAQNRGSGAAQAWAERVERASAAVSSKTASALAPFWMNFQL